MITSSLDWSAYELKLIRQSRKLEHKHDIQKMISNISAEVIELSRAEVELRRGNKYATKPILEKINKDIEIVEEFLLVAALIG